MPNGQGPPTNAQGRAQPFETVPKGLTIAAQAGDERQYKHPRNGRWYRIEIIDTDDSNGQIIHWRYK